MAFETNYGATLTVNAVSVGKCAIIDFPEIATGKAITTNHDGGGWAESIPNGLISLGDITLSVLMEAATLAGIRTSMLAKTVSPIVIDTGFETLTFDGYYLSVKEEPADAQNPDAAKATLVIACTADITIA